MKNPLHWILIIQFAVIAMLCGALLISQKEVKDLQQRISVLEKATEKKDPQLSFIEEAIEESFSLGFKITTAVSKQTLKNIFRRKARLPIKIS